MGTLNTPLEYFFFPLSGPNTKKNFFYVRFPLLNVFVVIQKQTNKTQVSDGLSSLPKRHLPEEVV